MIYRRSYKSKNEEQFMGEDSNFKTGKDEMEEGLKIKNDEVEQECLVGRRTMRKKKLQI